MFGRSKDLSFINVMALFLIGAVILIVVLGMFYSAYLLLYTLSRTLIG